MIEFKEITVDADKSDVKEINEIYIRYLKALKPFSADIQSFSTIHLINTAIDEVRTAAGDKNAEIMFIKNGLETVGFIILGHAPNSYGIMDMYVQEFYILEKYQRRGYGTVAVRKIIEKDPTADISLFILEKNKRALSFWNKVMPELGFTDFAKSGDIVAPNPGEDSPVRLAKLLFQYWKRL